MAYYSNSLVRFLQCDVSQSDESLISSIVYFRFKPGSAQVVMQVRPGLVPGGAPVNGTRWGRGPVDREEPLWNGVVPETEAGRARQGRARQTPPSVTWEHSQRLHNVWAPRAAEVRTVSSLRSRGWDQTSYCGPPRP